MTNDLKKLRLVGFEGRVKDNMGCDITSAVAELAEDRYWKYSNRYKKGEARCINTRAEIEEFQRGGALTLVPEENQVEVIEGQSVLALKVKKDFLSAVGLDAPPAAFQGMDIQWIEFPDDKNPCYAAFMPEQKAREMQHHWGKALLERSVATADQAKTGGNPIPYKDIHRLAQYGLHVAHDETSRALRYQFQLRYLAAMKQDSEKPYAYGNLKEIFLPAEFPHVTGNEIDEDVQNLVESGCTSVSVPLARNLQADSARVITARRMGK